MQSQHRSTPTTLAFHASRIVIDVGVLLAMASLSLDFVKSPAGNRSALQADALPAVILLLPIFLITLLPDHTRPLPRPLSWASLVLGMAAFPYAVVKHLDASVLADTLGGSVGIGARLLVFGTLVTLVGIIIGLTRAFLGIPTGANPTRRTRPAAAKRSKPRSNSNSATTMVAVAAQAPNPTEDAESGAKDETEAAPAPVTQRPEKGEANPFGEPLFDSLEIPAFVESSDAASGSTLIFDAENASERVADDEPAQSDDD